MADMLISSSNKMFLKVSFQILYKLNIGVLKYLF